MSSERQPGEAGMVPQIAEPAPTINIIPDHNITEETTGPATLNKLRRWKIIAAVGSVAAALATPLTFEEQPAYAYNTEVAVVGMPFQGNWSTYVHPSTHSNYSADWATDIYAAPGTEAKLSVGSVSGEAAYIVSNVADTSCGAGKRVRVNVKVDNVDVGWVQYEHLDTGLTDGTALTPGAVLGKTKNWGNLSCYQVTNNSGVHLHVGMKNVQDNHSCYVSYPNQGVLLSEGASLGTLGSPNTDIKQACTSIPVAQTPPPPPHLTIIQHQNSASGMTEAKKLNADTNYTSWLGGWITPDGAHSGMDVDYGMADANQDGTPDLYKIQHQNTNSGMTEIQIMNGTTNYTTWLGGWITPDGTHSGNDVHYVVGDYNRDNKPDVYAIQHWNTASGKTEVKIMNGATNNTTWLGGWVTPEGWHSGNDIDFVTSECGVNSAPYLYEILHQNTNSGMIEIKQLNGVTNYTDFIGGWITPEGTHSGNDVKYTAAGCNTNGKPNIYEIQNNNTISGMTEIKELNGATNYTSWLGGWITPDGAHSGNDVHYVTPQ